MIRKLSKSISLFLFLHLLVSTTSGQTETLIRLDLENARGGTASQIFDSIQFIPLETTKNSLFGTINQLEVSDSLFFILDISSRSILIFKKNGAFHTRIYSRSGDSFFGFFTIDHVTKRIVVNNNFTDSLLVYDFNGKPLRSLPTIKPVHSLYYYGNNKMLFFQRRTGSFSESDLRKYDLLLTDSNAIVKKYMHPYNAKFENGEYNVENNPINFSGQPGSCMFSLPFDYTLYQLNDTGILNKYKFVLPMEYSLPVNFATDSRFKGKRPKYVYSDPLNKRKIRSISTAYRINDYLIFSAPDGRLTIGDDVNYLYNLKNGSLLSFSKVTGDTSSYYIPLLSSMFEKILTVRNDRIYSSFPSFRLLSFKNDLSMQATYPESLKTLMSVGTKNDNPVIVVLQVKQKL